MPNFAEKLKKKWNITTTRDFYLIMAVFSLAGMFIVYERKPLFHLMGITDHTPFVIKFFCWLLVVFPSYQINLLIFGFLLGQFSFFWEKEKNLVRFLTGRKKTA